MKQAMDEVKMVVEGVYLQKQRIALARKYEVAMPTIEEINHVLFDDKLQKTQCAIDVSTAEKNTAM